MTDAQMGRCRKRLEQFLVDLLEPVGRSERRHWGSVYVRGLLLDGERKSVGPMAQRMVKGRERDAVWVIDVTGCPKQCGQYVGVARQYSGTLGKTAICQVA